MTSPALTPLPGDAETGRRAGPGSTARQVRDLLLVLIAGVALLAAGAAGYELANRGQLETPTSGSVEAGFARDMSAHHAQAVQMSLITHDNTYDPLVKLMTYDIATGQQAQIGIMSGWLTEWGLNQTDSSQTRMAWMTDSGKSRHGRHGTGGAPAPDGMAGTGPGGASMRLLPDGRMPGIASGADLARLRSLRGQQADVLWLQLMITHHRGGIDMARTALELTDRPAVRLLAQSVVDSQSAEVTAMQDMLRERGAAPA